MKKNATTATTGMQALLEMSQTKVVELKAALKEVRLIVKHVKKPTEKQQRSSLVKPTQETIDKLETKASSYTEIMDKIAEIQKRVQNHNDFCEETADIIFKASGILAKVHVGEEILSKNVWGDYITASQRHANESDDLWDKLNNIYHEVNMTETAWGNLALDVAARMRDKAA